MTSHSEPREADPHGPITVAGHDLQALFAELYATSGARELDLSFSTFAERLAQIAHACVPARQDRNQIIHFFRSLHIDELALALSCSKGSAAAWERFIATYERGLYAMALSMARNEQVAQELAASLSGELFSSARGVDMGDAKFASYSGRGSLAGWLRAILTHAYADRYRAARRTISLEGNPAFLKAIAINHPAESAVPDSRLASALQEALSGCTPKQRFLLAAYFFDQRTLAEIARALGIHESTASRQLKRLLAVLRTNIKRSLRKNGMTERQIAESFESDIRNLPFDLLGAFSQGAMFGRE